MSFDQGEFNFQAKGSEDGYRRWREDLEAKQKAFEAKWGVILGAKVVVSLRGFAKPVKGRLTWDSRRRSATVEEPKFKIGTLEFSASEIVSLMRDDEDPAAD